jgi:hypothetical protein
VILVNRIAALVQELRGDRARFHPSSQQESRAGIVLRFLGWPCEFGRDCAYQGLGWRCGHRRWTRGELVVCDRCGQRSRR